jgi:hypothetical protein
LNSFRMGSNCRTRAGAQVILIVVFLSMGFPPFQSRLGREHLRDQQFGRPVIGALSLTTQARRLLEI